MQGVSQSSAHRHHAIDYVELTVTDLEQAKRFYSEAFGWRFNDYGPEYAGIQSPQGASVPEVGGLSRARRRGGGPLGRCIRLTWTGPLRRCSTPAARW